MTFFELMSETIGSIKADSLKIVDGGEEISLLMGEVKIVGDDDDDGEDDRVDCNGFCLVSEIRFIDGPVSAVGPKRTAFLDRGLSKIVARLLDPDGFCKKEIL